MPWEPRKVGENWCSVNMDTGKSVACFGPNGEEKAKMHVKALYANTKEKLEEGEDFGLTLLRVAYTNEPHLDLRKHPISVLEIDGEEYVRHPILVAGHYRHPNGVLNLNTVPVTDSKHRFNRILANHYNRVTQSGVYTRPHHQSREAWTWLSTEHGGWLTVEEEDGDTLLVGYGKPTSEQRLQALKQRDYLYTSADLHLRYKSNRLDLEQDIISWEQLQMSDQVHLQDLKDVKTIKIDGKDFPDFIEQSLTNGSLTIDGSKVDDIDDDFFSESDISNVSKFISKLKIEGMSFENWASKNSSRITINGQPATEWAKKHQESLEDDSSSAIIKLFNPYHDKSGRFTSGKGGGAGGKGAGKRSVGEKLFLPPGKKWSSMSKKEKAVTVATNTAAVAIIGVLVGSTVKKAKRSLEIQFIEENLMSEGSLTIISLEKSEHERLLDAAKKAEEALAKIKRLEKERDDLKTKVTQLESQSGDDPDPDLPEGVRRELEQMRLELEQAKDQRVMDRLKLALKQAGKPDKDGGILDAFTINSILQFAQGQEIKDEESGLIVKLEQSASPHEQRRQTLEFLTYLLENAPRIPGAKTAGTEQRLEQNSNGQIVLGEEDTAEIQAAWGGAPNSNGGGA